MKHFFSFDRFFLSGTRIRKLFIPPLLLIVFFSLLSTDDSNANTEIISSILPPVAVCKNITVQLGSDGSVTITGTDVNSGSYDPDGVIASLTVNPITFTCSQIGSNSVTLTVTDNEGLSSTCNATVTVEDNTPPIVNVKPFELVLGASGTGTLLTANIDNGSSDNCGPVTLSLSQVSFTCSDLGDNTITLTAVDSHGNSSSRSTTVTVSSTVEITAVSLSSCDLSPSLALFESTVNGGNGTYSYLWKGVDETTRPFMVIVPFPPSLQFFNTSILEKPFFNNTMADGLYDISLVVTDGNGCTDTSEIRIRKSGIIFNNQTMIYSDACEGEVKTYSVKDEPDATYSWSVVNGTILSAVQNTKSIDVQWNMGVLTGVVTATLHEPNGFFPGGQCESSVVDSVTLASPPLPAFNNPTINVCSGSENIYTLTNTYIHHYWTVTGGTITGGGNISDNFVTIRWGTGPSGSILISAGNTSSCTGSGILNISVSDLSGSITSRSDITCNGSSDGSVTAIADAGTGQEPYSYSVDGGAWQSGGTFNGLPLGNHVVTIRDALLCTFDLSFIISQPATVTGSIQAKTDVSCFGGTNGSVTISAAGGTPPYQYSLNGGSYQNQNNFNGLSAGSYTVTIRDNHNCTGNVPVSITQPAAALTGTVSVTNVNCFGGLTGRADLTVSGGSAPYTFLWSSGAKTEDLVDIGAGNYTVLITDTGGCTTSVPATVTQPATALTGSTSVVNIFCFGATTGAVTLTVAGGTIPYTYLWSNGATTKDITNLSAGNYSVTITDSNGCKVTTTGSVTGPSTAVGGSISSQTNVLCRGLSNGGFTISGTGGVGPYEYRLGTGAYQASGTFGSLAAGTYNITIRDANICTFSLPVNITEPAALLDGSITIQTNILCFGGTSGSITVGATGGTSPYQFNIDGGAFQANGTFSNLNEGAHTIVIRDNNLCTKSLPAVLSQPTSALNGGIVSQTNVSCFGTATGSVSGAGSGGTPPYTYSIDAGTFQSTGTFGNLAAGAHSITVRDLNLCQFNVPVTITQPVSAPGITILHTDDVTVYGGNDGSVAVTGSGGTPPYDYRLNAGTYQSSGTFGSLVAGSYTVSVRDAHLCTSDVVFTITQPTIPLTLDIISQVSVACKGGITGSVTVGGFGGISPYEYRINGGTWQSSGTFASLGAGDYTLTVRDASSALISISVTITEPDVLDLTMSFENILCYGASTGTATVAAAGGMPPYSYSWSTTPVQTTPSISDLEPGNYTVTVTDNNGCIKTGSVSITGPAELSLSASTTIASCPDSEDGSIILTIAGGIGPYTVIWSDGVSTQNRTKIIPGTYSVVVTDQNTCARSLVVEVSFAGSFSCVVIPQLITPNNDGYNDEWVIRNIDIYPDAEIRVFNRWGKLVFSTRNLSADPWDGTFNGKLVPTDSYHYILYLNDGSAPRSGVISVIR